MISSRKRKPRFEAICKLFRQFEDEQMTAKCVANQMCCEGYSEEQIALSLRVPERSNRYYRPRMIHT
jgi:hypothetical protein